MDSILLIDDAPQVAGIIISKLGREGFEVIWKRDRDSAFQALQERTPQLIFLSTYLEKRNAWEIADELRRTHPNIPMVMLLEQEESEHETRARALGCADCIIKPFKPTALARTIRDVLDKKPKTSKV